jgi:hypothetical protein
MKMDDARFDAWTLPSPDELTGLVGGPVEELLVVGSEAPTSISAIDCRVCDPLPNLPLPSGTWAFFVGGRWKGVVAGDGRSGAPRHGDLQSRLVAGTPAWAALVMAGISWDAATPFAGSRPSFGPGSLVTLRGGNGEIAAVVTTPKRTAGRWQYEIAFGGEIVRVPEDALLGVDADSGDIRSWIHRPMLGAPDVSRAITLLKVRHPLSDVLYSYGSTRTAFRSYQFKPLLKLLLTGSERLLIADEVGLGKTIEAGLIWTELDQRAGIRRGLVVCPASLTRKWQSEMKRRFDRDLELLDQRRLGEIAAALEDGRDVSFLGICSIESLRTSPHLDTLAEFSPRIDLVIVDEAHALRNTGTRSFQLGELLSDWADVLLFLSATPLNLGRDDLFNLLNLLNPEEFPDRAIFDGQIEPNIWINGAISALRQPGAQPEEVRRKLDALDQTPFGRLVVSRPEYSEIQARLAGDSAIDHERRSEITRLLATVNTLSNVVTRTRKADVPDAKATRVARRIDVAWSAEEAAFYAAVRNWARERALANNGVVGFATVMPLRQAASCLPAMARILKKRNSSLFQEADDLDDIDLPSEGDDVFIPSDAEVVLRDSARAIGSVDSKYDQFFAALQSLKREGLRQVMVFSFFRETLKYLGSTRERGDVRF